jgi:hypothetical protein
MPRRYKKGGQPRNDNAATHRSYCKFIDKRTRDGQWIKNIFLCWINDLGGLDEVQAEVSLPDGSFRWNDAWFTFNGNLASMQLSVLENLAIICWRCRRLGRVIVGGNGDVPESVTRDFLRFHNALVDGLSKIGLERNAKEIVPTLQQYLASKQQQIQQPVSQEQQ